MTVCPENVIAQLLHFDRIYSSLACTASHITVCCPLMQKQNIPGNGGLGSAFLQVKLKHFLALMPADDNEAAQVAANGGYF